MSKQTEYDLQVLIHYNQQEQYGVRDELGRLWITRWSPDGKRALDCTHTVSCTMSTEI